MRSFQFISFFCLTLHLIACQEEEKPKIYFGDLHGDKVGRVEMLEGLPEGTVASHGPGVYLTSPVSQDLTIYFSSVGTAEENEDFIITNPLIVRKGNQFGSLNLKFISDMSDEFNEKGDLLIESVSSGNFKIISDTGKFLILDDDLSDLSIQVSWPSFGNSDLDLYLWREKTTGSNEYELVKKAENRPPFSLSETLDLSGLEIDGVYALSYLYFGGVVDQLNIKVQFTPLGSAILDGGKSSLEFTATYKPINLNTGTAPKRIQFFTKEGNQYHSFTGIEVPETGS